MTTKIDHSQTTVESIFIPAEIKEPRPATPLLTPIPAGWPSPAENYIEDYLDLHKLVVKNEAATFFMRVTGHSMVGAGIHDGDLLVVDRSKTPLPGKVVVAAVDGELTIKRLVKREQRLWLVPANPDFPETDLAEKEDASIWGVVTHVLHQL
jgi:DNA polymerase V